MRTYLSAITIGLLMVLPVYAQEENAAANAPMERKRIELRSAKEITPQTLREAFGAAQRELQARRDVFLRQMEAARTETGTKIQEEKQRLAERLGLVRDERKRQIVERINVNLLNVNDRRISETESLLTEIEDVLMRIISRRDKAAANGFDVGTVDGAIGAADAAIESARAAIEEQARRTYIINVTDEATLREKIASIRTAIFEDLRRVREAVRAAHDAVRRAALALAQNPRIDEEPPESSQPEKPEEQSTSTAADADNEDADQNTP